MEVWGFESQSGFPGNQFGLFNIDCGSNAHAVTQPDGSEICVANDKQAPKKSDTADIKTPGGSAPSKTGPSYDDSIFPEHHDTFNGEVEAPDGTHPRINLDKFIDPRTGLPKNAKPADKDIAYDQLTVKGSRYESIISFTDKLGKSHSYRCKYAEDDGLPGVTSAKEANEIRRWLLENIEKKAVLVGLSTYDPSFRVQYLGMGEDEHDIRIVSTTRQGLNHLIGSENEAAFRNAEAVDMAMNNYLLKLKQTDPISAKEKEKDWAAIILDLLMALEEGNLDILPTLFQALAAKSGLSVAQVVSIVAKGLGMADEEAKNLGNSIADATGQSGTKDRHQGAAVGEKLKRLEVEYDIIKNKRNALGELATRVLAMMEELTQQAAKLAQKWDDVKQKAIR